jgi:membrane dipeptidase
MSDEMLRSVRQNDGVVMVNSGGSFLDRRKAGTWKGISDILVDFGPSRVPLGSLLEHIDHVARVAGIDHVGLGSNFDGTMFFPRG